jgi:polysaccharide export outer membrane protein
MRKLTYTYLILGIIFLSTACSTRQYQSLFQRKNTLSDTLSQKSNVVISEYRIKSQDILQIRNLQDAKYIANEAPINANITTGSASQGQTYQVEEDGTVALPVLGHIPVVGLTRVEAQRLVESLYKKDLLKNPIIELKIINLKVSIFGEVRAQGNYPLIKDKTTLVEVIGEAGGLTEKANEKAIKIIRGNEKNPQEIVIDFSDIRSINAPNTILQSGDIIYIAQNNRTARNENLQNFSFLVQPALLLFNTALIIFTLVKK